MSVKAIESRLFPPPVSAEFILLEPDRARPHRHLSQQLIDPALNSDPQLAL